MSKTLPTDCSKLSFSRLDDAARKTKFVIRKSLKFSAARYLFALINAILTGRASFNQLAMGLKHSEPISLKSIESEEQRRPFSSPDARGNDLSSFEFERDGAGQKSRTRKENQFEKTLR